MKVNFFINIGACLLIFLLNLQSFIGLKSSSYELMNFYWSRIFYLADKPWYQPTQFIIQMHLLRGICGFSTHFCSLFLLFTVTNFYFLFHNIVVRYAMQHYKKMKDPIPILSIFKFTKQMNHQNNNALKLNVNL